VSSESGRHDVHNDADDRPAALIDGRKGFMADVVGVGEERKLPRRQFALRGKVSVMTRFWAAPSGQRETSDV
jgi:hypothetical protein